jgi:hypothetical protein
MMGKKVDLEVFLERREFFRRSLAGGLGVAVTSIRLGEAAPHFAIEFPADFNASKDLARTDWKPVFLDEHQNVTLIVMSELILPATDTPGAKEALANRFIDRLLAAESRDIQRDFLASLAYLDGECLKRYRSAFVHLARDEQLEFLELIAYPHSLVTWGENRSEFAGHDHFRHLKRWIVQAYYSSEIGMQELGWDGGAMHGDFKGCQHPQGKHE